MFQGRQLQKVVNFSAEKMLATPILSCDIFHMCFCPFAVDKTRPSDMAFAVARLPVCNMLLAPLNVCCKT